MSNDVKVKTQFKGVFILLITAFVWGTSFIAQRLGTDEGVQAFTFQGIRTLLGALVLLPFILIRDKVSAKKMTDEQLQERKKTDKKTLIYGSILGIVLCAATDLQQFSFYWVESAGKIAFITAMYMFFVPIIGLFFGKRVPLITWICVIMGFIGLYFLCFKSGEGFGSIGKGEICAFLCALFFCLQILLIEKFAPDCDGIKLSCVQFAVSGTISFILMWIFEKPQIAALKQALAPILYSGIMSCGVAYTFQIIGQKYCEATIASLLMCMESVFAVLAEVLLSVFGIFGLSRVITTRELIGCIIMFAAIILSQLADMIKEKK